MATTKRKTTKTASKRAAAKSTGADLATIGRYTFLGGLAAAAIAGALFSLPSFYVQSWQAPIVYVLMLLALVGGYLHVSKESEKGFLLVALSMYFFADRLSFLPYVGSYLSSILGVVGLFLAVAAIAVAVRIIVGWFRS